MLSGFLSSTYLTQTEIATQLDQAQQLIQQRLTINYSLSANAIDQLYKLSEEFNALSHMLKDPAITSHGSFFTRFRFKQIIRRLHIHTNTLEKVLAEVAIPQQVSVTDKLYNQKLNRIAFRGTDSPPAVIFKTGFCGKQKAPLLSPHEPADPQDQVRLTSSLQSKNVFSFSKNMDAAALYPQVHINTSTPRNSYIYLAFLSVAFDVHSHSYLTTTCDKTQYPTNVWLDEEICAESVPAENVFAVFAVERQIATDTLTAKSYNIQSLTFNPLTAKRLAQLENLTQQKTLLQQLAVMRESLSGLVDTTRHTVGHVDRVVDAAPSSPRFSR